MGPPIHNSGDYYKIGSYIGLDLVDEIVFGTIIEFDDLEDEVTIEQDGTGRILTGNQKDMFIPEW